MATGRYRLDDFELYQLARTYRKKVYQLIRQLPTSERDCLTPQMRRAAISINNNVAEGHGRWHFQENIRFCRIARGSLTETIDDLNICEDEHYGNAELVRELKRDAESLLLRINGYIAYLNRSKQDHQPHPTTKD